MSMKEIIRVEDVFFQYEKEFVLQGINLNIYRTDFLGIVGANGGGKSTLLKLILGILKPTKGEVWKEPQVSMSYVPQYLRFDKDFPMIVRDVIQMGLIDEVSIRKPFFSKKAKERVKTILSDLSLEALGEKRFGSLSGGQRQQVLIARALVSDPDILLLDEPMANVDEACKERISRILESLKNSHTLVMVSHDPDFISSSVDKVVCVNRRIKFHKTRNVDCEHFDILGRNISVVDHSNKCKNCVVNLSNGQSQSQEKKKASS